MEQYENKLAWLNARRSGIGASDAPAIVGASRFKGAFELYAEKASDVAPPDEETDAMRWGSLLEPAIAEEYQAKAQRTLVNPWSYSLTRSLDHAELFATLDYLLPNPGLSSQVALPVEIKATSFYHANEWVEEPPLEYLVQLQHQLFVTTAPWGSLAVLFMSGRSLTFRWWDIPRNERFITTLVAEELAFWRRVQERRPPPPSGRDTAKELLRRMYPRETPGLVISLSDKALQADHTRQEAQKHLDYWESQHDEANNIIKAEIGAAEHGILPDGTIYSWKAATRAGYSVQPTTVRTLRRKTAAGR